MSRDPRSRWPPARDKKIGKLPEPREKVDATGDGKNRPGDVDFAPVVDRDVTGDPSGAACVARRRGWQAGPRASASRDRASAGLGASPFPRPRASVSRRRRRPSRDRASVSRSARSASRDRASRSRGGGSASRDRVSMARGARSASRQGRRASRDRTSRSRGRRCASRDGRPRRVPAGLLDHRARPGGPREARARGRAAEGGRRGVVAGRVGTLRAKTNGPCRTDAVIVLPVARHVPFAVGSARAGPPRRFS